jgi:hypothetical protein
MSLTSISASASTGINQAPVSQVIGKNGSFWLPEKIDESFASKVRDSAPKADGKKSQALKDGKSGHSKSSGRSSSAEPSLSRTVPGTEAKTPQGRTVTSPLPGKTRLAEARLPSSQSGKAPAVLSPRVDQLQRQGVAKVQVLQQGKLSKNSIRNHSLVAENYKDSIIDPDARKDDGNKNGKRRGAKNASNHSKMEVSHAQQEIQVTEGRESKESLPSSTPQARTFLNLLTKSVLPRISYLDKHAKKVVRFAVDLPNKVKLGVRLENSGGSLSICFICSDPESLEMLGFTKDALSESLSDQSGKNTQINVFNNYKEMDQHFSRAA